MVKPIDVAKKRRGHITMRLLNAGVIRSEDGRKLYELSLPELDRLYIKLRIEELKEHPIQLGH